ncbi:MAG TPA: hypothetical protein VGW80_09300 [Solirubrobacterales bacterium]|jgi:hypothetical protein|nr:hypothetical protein [Solirubrobacterales bacterium]
MNRFAPKAAKLALAALAALSFSATLTSPALADFGVTPGSFRTDVLDAAGNVVPTPQAGGHPFVYRLGFALNTKPSPFPEGGDFGLGPEPIPDGTLKDVRVELPPGVAGRPQAIPQCTTADFTPPGFGGLAHCPTASQVGIADLDLGLSAGWHSRAKIPIYNLVPPEGVVARIGFVPTVPVVVDFKVRTGDDYGVTAIVRNTSQGVNFYSSIMDLWGVPADPRHDAERYLPGAFVPGDANGSPLTAGMNPTPFMDLPTRCGVPMKTHMEVDSWEEAGNFLSYETPPLEMSGCDRLQFAPSVEIHPDSAKAGSPAGLGVGIEIPQSSSPDAVITPPLKKAEVALPEGVTVNASSAAGLASCSPEQIGLDEESVPSCPNESKLGSVEIETPLLNHTLEGSLYLATQGSNPFHSLLAFYLVVVDPDTGLVIKLPGKVEPDPRTGRLITTFDDNPQLAVESVHLQFRGGSNAPLALPSACGIHAAHAKLSDWAHPDVVVPSNPSFSVNDGCEAASRFAPALDGGTVNPSAGKSSPFVFRVTRGDGEQNLGRIDANLPEGLLAKLAGVPVCGDAESAAADCLPDSQIGKATVGVGAGPNPLFLPEAGKAPTAAYLAGPYKGAPYSLVVEVPAQAGPFDLGTVVVRSAIHIDPVTTRVSVDSDPLPQILEGIPIAYREVRVEIDRRGFMRNPTSCEPMEVSSTIVSAQGTSASPTARFQAADCARLGFKPKLSLVLGGRTHRSAHPRLKAVLKMPKGEANIDEAVVTLPRTEFLENAHIRTICTRVQYAAHNCPRGSIYGYAKAWTPLLDKRLQGPVYLRSSNHTLPDLVASLDGQIHVDLAGRIDSVNQRLRTTFWAVPDAPVSKFVLTMKGGDKGLLVNNTELCKAKPRARAQFTGQNGKSRTLSPLVKIGCRKK